MSMAKLGVAFGMIVLLAGCVSAPPPAEGRVSAYSVGDRGRVVFDEVVVSLSLRSADGTWFPGYQNLHVVPAALVNYRGAGVTRGGDYTASSGYTPSSASEVEGILQRLEIRVNARLSEVLSQLQPQSLKDTATLRAIARDAANSVVKEGLAQWEYGENYKVEIVIESLYWTDSSVGRAAQPRGRWF
jgi:hypothetical protein